ncbi:MAG TPA: U32 family peptidase [bacterium]|nr:U32 family peptidase [bacterium]
MAELLAPAGNPEKLLWATVYGADAVYFGVDRFSLRSFAGNFTVDDAQIGLEYLHKNGKKGYVTLNIYPYSGEYGDLIRTAHELEDCKADAFIVSDIGVINELKKAGIKTDIHISTQANTVSYQAVDAYFEMGAHRVNLARELSFEKIVEITKKKNPSVEVEVFIHGAVCFSFSGRCAISDWLTGRKANRGECTHPCRWNYAVVEEKRPGVFMNVGEDERGTYLFNPKELALFEYMKPLSDAGVSSFKIEGRMKSIHYIASTISLYKRLLNGENIPKDEVFKLLNRIKNRGYSTGFMKGNVTPDDYQREGDGSNSEADFVANITDEKKDGDFVVEVRNRLFAGETLEVLEPSGKTGEIKMPEIFHFTDGTSDNVAHHSKKILLKGDFTPYTIFRRIDK